MPEPESSETLDELSHEITVEILRKLETKKKIGRLSLSGNYICQGESYTCGFNYSCNPKAYHYCKKYFECSDGFGSTPNPLQSWALKAIGVI